MLIHVKHQGDSPKNLFLWALVALIPISNRTRERVFYLLGAIFQVHYNRNMSWQRIFGRKKKSLGERGETLAARFLEEKGYAILAQNYSNPSGRRLGEIDIVARQKKTIVFVEVKTLAGSALPEGNINRAKLQRLEKIAAYYLKSRHLDNISYRFDAISVRLDEDTGRKEIRHLESIFL